jgi:uncharacterized phage protein (TIGR02216 family)
MTGFDWPLLMQAGLRGLGLKPKEFWALTPAELEMMLGKPESVMPLKRARFEDLMRDYPDQPFETEDGTDGST